MGDLTRIDRIVDDQRIALDRGERGDIVVADRRRPSESAERNDHRHDNNDASRQSDSGADERLLGHLALRTTHELGFYLLASPRAVRSPGFATSFAVPHARFPVFPPMRGLSAYADSTF